MPHFPQDRPTSPHLTVYRPQMSSVLSITHRLTGVALYGGTFLLLAWLWSAAYSADCYRAMHAFLASTPGMVLLIGWTAAFYFHFANGIRHLFWDAGKGFSLPAMHRSGWLVIFFTLALTGLTWGFVLAAAPGGMP